MDTSREPLTPEVWARTILAARARVVVCESQGPGEESIDHLGILFDHSGAAWLVLGADHDVPRGPLLINCRAGVSGLGVLRMVGSCAEPVSPNALPALAGMLERHLVRSGERAYGPGDTATHTEGEEVLLAAVRLEVITLIPPPAGTGLARQVTVDVDAFASAEADRWIVDADSIRERLEHNQQHELCTLAQQLTALDCSAVVVQAMDPDHLDLACLSTDGVTCVRVDFGTRMDRPSLVRPWVAARARRPA